MTSPDPAPNVFITVDNPQELYDGTHPLAPFPVRWIDLYRYASRLDALNDNSPTLVKTFPLTTTTQSSQYSGPYTYATYDPSSTSTTWYAYRFRSDPDSSSNVYTSELSAPWAALSYSATTLRQVLEDLPSYFGDLFRIYSATAFTTSTATIPALNDPNIMPGFWNGWHLLCLDAQGYQHSRISSVSGNVATLNPPFSSAPTAGRVMLFPLLDWETIRSIINGALFDMQVLRRFSYPSGRRELDAPMGVNHPSDIIDAREYLDSEVWRPCRFEVLDSDPIRIRIDSTPVSARVELFVLGTLGELDGTFTDLSSGVQAPLRWLSAVAAYAIAYACVNSAPGDASLVAIAGLAERKAKEATARYAPEVQRSAATLKPWFALPGPTMR